MEIPNVFSSKSIWPMLAVFAVVLSAFLLIPWHGARAANDASEYVYFRIDTELDVLEAKTALIVDWSCSGTASGSITDNTASESTQALDGIVKVASVSKEWTDSTCSTKNGGTIRAKAYVNGWVTRRWTAVFLASTSYSSAFTTTASLDYNLVLGPVKDELDTSITLNTGTASASYSGTTASSSYSGTKKYVAATGDGTITVGNGGYVDKTQAVTWSSDYRTASKSATFDGTSGTYNVGKLQYASKITYNTTDWRGTIISSRPGATVAAGASSTACTDSSGVYYCPVPVANGTSGTTATATLATFTTSNTCTLTDRTSNASNQSTCTINAVQDSNVTMGGSGSAQVPVEATPTPTPTPTVPAEATPTPTVVAEATPTPTPTPTVAAGTVKLFRKANDPKVYVQRSDGTLSWVKTLAEFNAAGYKWTDVKVISGSEFGKMRVGGSLRVAKGIAYLRVRSSPSTAGKVVGKVLPNQELKFTEIKNGWYHIDSGWISGAYAKEF